jgi:hypothetical protein
MTKALDAIAAAGDGHNEPVATACLARAGLDPDLVVRLHLLGLGARER